MNGYRALIGILILGMASVSDFAAPRSIADSALDLISGFDIDRIDLTFPADSDDSIGELAKLMYRLRKVDRQALANRVDGKLTPAIGDAIQFDGMVESIRTIDVPEELVEFLDFSKLQLLTISAGNSKVEIVTDKINRQTSIGDRVEGVGLAIELRDSAPAAIATAVVRWFPQQVPNVGWKLLRNAGVDISLVSDLPSRDRRPLVADDSEVFYAMLAAAAKMFGRDDLDDPIAIEPLVMLQEPDDLVGQWIQADLETVQITRVFVTDPNRRSQLGRDHFYQIDAVGDLGNVVVKIEPKDRNGQPALFEGRYPVSIVTPALPEFLAAQLVANSGSEEVVTLLHTKIGVNAFFFRLWSYDSDFMNQHGGGQQFGPLLVAVTLTDREPARGTMDRTGMIGTLAAMAVIAGVLITFLWHRKTSAQDRAVRQRRQAREAERVDFPSSSS